MHVIDNINYKDALSPYKIIPELIVICSGLLLFAGPIINNEIAAQVGNHKDFLNSIVMLTTLAACYMASSKSLIPSFFLLALDGYLQLTPKIQIMSKMTTHDIDITLMILSVLAFVNYEKSNKVKEN
ncbi:MAG: hypothetical protein GY874_04420 [Desulfobacteraceae bacterium]|nr:hypothetical protein [Desulfobacteraceae bacterium]